MFTHVMSVSFFVLDLRNKMLNAIPAHRNT